MVALTPPSVWRQELVWHKSEVLKMSWGFFLCFGCLSSLAWWVWDLAWGRADRLSKDWDMTGLSLSIQHSIELTISLQLVGATWGDVAWVQHSVNKFFPCLSHLSSFSCCSLFIVPVQLSWSCAVKRTALCSQGCCSLGRSIPGVTLGQAGAFCWSWAQSRDKKLRQSRFLWLVSCLIHC